MCQSKQLDRFDHTHSGERERQLDGQVHQADAGKLQLMQQQQPLLLPLQNVSALLAFPRFALPFVTSEQYL